MELEELFCKLYPEYSVNGKPLSPYFDLFESGYEQSEKRIAELEARLEREKNLNQCLSDHNEQLRELIEKMKCCYNCKFDNLEPPEVISNGVCENCINHSKWELED